MVSASLKVCKGCRSRRLTPSPPNTCETSCSSDCTTIRPTMMSVNERVWPRNLPSSLALTPVGCFDHITCFCTMTPSPLTCQPKLSKGFRQIPFLDSQIPNMTPTNYSCNCNGSGIEFGSSRQHQTSTGSSTMRTKLLPPASSPHVCGTSWRL